MIIIVRGLHLNQSAKKMKLIFFQEVRPYDACFPWYARGSGTCRRLDPVDPVDDVPPPAATVETNFDKDQTVILHQAYDGFQVIAAETGSLYEQLRRGDHGDLGQASADCSTSYEGYCLSSSQWCSLPCGPNRIDAHHKHLHHSI